MIEVRIPKEITEYKEKIIFGLSIRQLLCFSIAMIVGITTYIFSSKLVGTNIAGYIVIAETMPVFAIGFIRKNGFAFEEYLMMILKHKLGNHKRRYETNLLIDQVRSDKNVTIVKTKNKAANEKRRECEIFKSTKESRKRKIKEAIGEIKAAKQEYRRKE